LSEFKFKPGDGVSVYINGTFEGDVWTCTIDAQLWVDPTTGTRWYNVIDDADGCPFVEKEENMKLINE